jgi:hypothetical protein
VTAFNGTLACETANEVLKLLTGIRRGNEMKRVYNGFSGTILECTTNKGPTAACPRNDSTVEIVLAAKL